MGIPLLVLVILWWARPVFVRLMPIRHEGVVQRIVPFNKGYRSNTRQQVQFAIIFEDGFQCEGYDTSFAAVREGDRIAIRGYHDVAGWPLLDPEWWECDEGQLDKLLGTAP